MNLLLNAAAYLIAVAYLGTTTMIQSAAPIVAALMLALAAVVPLFPDPSPLDEPQPAAPPPGISSSATPTSGQTCYFSICPGLTPTPVPNTDPEQVADTAAAPPSHAANAPLTPPTRPDHPPAAPPPRATPAPQEVIRIDFSSSLPSAVELNGGGIVQAADLPFSNVIGPPLMGGIYFGRSATLLVKTGHTFNSVAMDLASGDNTSGVRVLVLYTDGTQEERLFAGDLKGGLWPVTSFEVFAPGKAIAGVNWSVGGTGFYAFDNVRLSYR